MTTSFFFLFACFSTTSVPCTLVSIVCTGCSTISLTPTAAARWKTTSLRSISSASSGSLLTESMMYSKPGRPLRCAMLSIDPVDRLSRTQHLVAAVEQRFGEMRSDEAGAAGDQRSHASTCPFSECAAPRRRLARRRRRSSRGWSGSDRTSSHDARGDRAVGRVDARRAPAAAESAPGSESASRCRAPRRCACSAVRVAARGRRTGDRRGRRRARRARRRALPAQRARDSAPRARAAGRSSARRSGSRARRIAACSSSSRELTPGSSMVVAVGLAAVAQPLDARRRARVVGDDRAAVAERAEILRRIEAERAGDADRADRPPVGGGEVRLAAVFDDREVVPRGDRARSPPCRRPVRTDAPAGSRACAA